MTGDIAGSGSLALKGDTPTTQFAIRALYNTTELSAAGTYIYPTYNGAAGGGTLVGIYGFAANNATAGSTATVHGLDFQAVAGAAASSYAIARGMRIKAIFGATCTKALYAYGIDVQTAGHAPSTWFGASSSAWGINVAAQ